MVKQRNPVEELKVTARWAANLLFAQSVVVFALLLNTVIDAATSGKTGVRLALSCGLQALFTIAIPMVLATIALALTRAATRV